MYKHILVPTDGSELSTQAVKHAVELAHALGARITGVHAMPEYMVQGYMEFPTYGQWSHDEFVRQTDQDAKKYLEVIKTEAQRLNVPCDVVAERTNQPFRCMIDVAQKRGCDLIVMASHGRRGLSALVLGSETHKLLTHSRVPVLVHR